MGIDIIWENSYKQLRLFFGKLRLCEIEDRELANFSIERDKKMLIPFIKAALEKTSVPLHIMASPWSPPPWMKTNNQMNHGGKLKEEYQDTGLSIIVNI